MNDNKLLTNTNKQKDNNTTIEMPISMIVACIALMLSLASFIQMRQLKEEIRDIEIFSKEYSNSDVIETSDSRSILQYPYYQTTRTENGITVNDNGDGSITLNGTCNKDSVIFRLAFSDSDIAIPLEKKKYIFIQGVNKDAFSSNCRIDLGVIKIDGAKEVLNGVNGDITIDNLNGQYRGIYAVSLYAVKSFLADDYTFNPKLCETE